VRARTPTSAVFRAAARRTSHERTTNAHARSAQATEPSLPAPRRLRTAGGSTAAGARRGLLATAGVAPDGGSCGSTPLPPCQTSSGLPSGGLSKLDSSTANTAGFSSTTAASYVSSMNSYASAYSSAGSGNIGNVATAVNNAATLLNNGSYFKASYAGTLRATLLSTMVSSLSGTGTPTNASDMYTSVAAFASLTSSSSLTSSGATSALSGLSTLAGHSSSVMTSTNAAVLTTALGNVIGGAGSATTYKSAVSVLSTLASSQGSGLASGESQSYSNTYFTVRWGAVRLSCALRSSAPDSSSSF
jgi:hypothetical protein